MLRTPRSAASATAAIAALALAASAALPGCDASPPPAPPAPPLQLPALVPPLRDAAPGEELVLRVGDTSFRWRLVRDLGHEVEVEYARYERDAPVAAPSRHVWHRNGFGLQPEWVIQSFVRERITVAGRPFDCWRLHVRSQKETRWYWISDEVPVHGIVRLAVDRGKGVPDETSQSDVVAEHCVPPVTGESPR